MEDKTICVNRVNFRGSDRLVIKYSHNKLIESLVKSLPGIIWSDMYQSWHVDFNPVNISLIKKKFSGIASLDFHLNNERKGIPSKSHTDEGLIPGIYYNLDKFESYLRHKRYSDSTIRNYLIAVRQFLNYAEIPVEKIMNSHLISYNNHLLVKGYSISFQNQVASGLKLFFSRIHNKEFEIEKIERPRREHKLPNVLSKEEIKRVLRSPVNMKHRVMLSIIYACGLRRSELINLKPGDIDSARGLLIIRQGKGRKDRIIPLPEKILDDLRIYYRAYRPGTWLFEGQYKNSQYSPTSLAKVLHRAVLKAGIAKPVSLHWLRHSYATHLLEQGTDLKIIQELLGHQSTKTTEIYTHVSTKSIQQVKSPFEDIDL